MSELSDYRRMVWEPQERSYRATIKTLRDREKALADSLRNMKELFRFALLNTTPEIAQQGMVFINEAEALLKEPNHG